MPDWFRLDRTAGQEHALYVAAEKDVRALYERLDRLEATPTPAA
ncbi:hypothetical protein OG906_42505 (plasmid) [Streptomyces sp. NBC_01426]|nr:hypothetical protein [Streptomyces sp. NBC_01426]